MVTCILGERKSGKSIFAEEQVKKKDGNVLYVATLPNLKIYEDVIARHQERRPLCWDQIELFEMAADQIADFPYQDYSHVIVDNLSYYMLFQRFHNGDSFLQKCDGRFFALIDKMAENRDTAVYFIDTPMEKEMLKSIDEEGIIERLFIKILDKSQMTGHFYSSGKICPLSAEEGKDYLFRI